MATATSGQNPTFRRDTEGVGTYHELTKEKVAYSVDLSDLVIADYDASGAVRGIEFVGKQEGPLDRYLELARKTSRGPVGKTRGPIPGNGSGN
jgi:Protein of unknown function (DUF2283)